MRTADGKAVWVATRISGMTKTVVLYDSAQAASMSEDDVSSGSSSTAARRIANTVTAAAMIEQRTGHSVLGAMRRVFGRHLWQSARGRGAGALALSVQLPHLGFSIIDRAPQELLYISLHDVFGEWVRVTHGSESAGRATGLETVECAVNLIQIDNQLARAHYEVLLGPTAAWRARHAEQRSARELPSRRTAADSVANPPPPPTLHVSLVRRLGFAAFDFFEYASFALQDLDLKIEDSTLLLLGRFMWESVVCWTSEERALGLGTGMAPTFGGTSAPSSPSTSDASSRSMATVDEAPALRQWVARRHHEFLSKYRLVASSSAGTTRVEDQGTMLRKMYVQFLHVHPIAVNLSFQFSAEDRRSLLSLSEFQRAATAGQSLAADGRGRGGGAGHGDTRPASGLTARFAGTGGGLFQSRTEFDPEAVVALLPPALLNIENAPLRLGAVLLPHVLSDRQQLIKTLGKQFLQGIPGQLYVVIGSVDILGNPVGLIKYISSGIADFVSEPLQGAMALSPQGFVLGVAKGTLSLVRGSVLGTFDALSKVSSGLGTGLSLLALDEQYVTMRWAALRQRRAVHAGAGLALGARCLAEGIGDGISGLVMHPLQGLEEERSLGGFARGVGRAVLGVAVKPVVGPLDFASNSAIGIRNTADALDVHGLGGHAVRVRLPRNFYGEHRILRPFSADDAFVAALLAFLRRQRAPAYLAHVPLEHSIVLVATSSRLYCLDYGAYVGFVPGRFTVSPTPTLLWEARTADVLEVRMANHEVHNGKVLIKLSRGDRVRVSESAAASLEAREELPPYSSAGSPKLLVLASSSSSSSSRSLSGAGPRASGAPTTPTAVAAAVLVVPVPSEVRARLVEARIGACVNEPA